MKQNFSRNIVIHLQGDVEASFPHGPQKKGIRHHPPLAICDTMVNHKNLQKIYAAELTRTIQRKITTQSEYSVLCNFLKCLHGEGNGTPLQYCCLENPMDGGAW